LVNSTPFNFSRVRALRGALCLAAASVSGAIYWFGTGLHPVWWLTWIAPVPVLLVALWLRPGPAFVAAFAAWFIGGLNEWSYMSLIAVPIPVRLVAIGVPALVFAFAASLNMAALCFDGTSGPRFAGLVIHLGGV
jgi:apolipoprotein N-acyltransferase